MMYSHSSALWCWSELQPSTSVPLNDFIMICCRLDHPHFSLNDSRCVLYIYFLCCRLSVSGLFFFFHFLFLLLFSIVYYFIILITIISTCTLHLQYVFEPAWKCVLGGCVSGCYCDLSFNIFWVFWFVFCEFSMFLFCFYFFSTTCDVWCVCCMLGRQQINRRQWEFHTPAVPASDPLCSSLHVRLRPVSLPERIHAPAHRCPLRQCQRGHAPAEPRSSCWLHSQGRNLWLGAH